MSRTSIRRAVRALPPPPPPAMARGYDHAMQYAKFFPVAPSAGAARAAMQYPDSLTDQVEYLDGWLTADLHLREDRALEVEVTP